MNQNYYYSSPTRRGYYPRGPSYGNNGYGYGNPPAIIRLNPKLHFKSRDCDDPPIIIEDPHHYLNHESDSNSSFSSESDSNSNLDSNSSFSSESD